MKLSFKRIQHWFGDRGIRLQRSYLKKYGNNNNYIYWMPNNQACNNSLNGDGTFFSSEYDLDNTVLWAIIRSDCFEVEDETYVDKVPFELNWSTRNGK
jgi:hypothetical protein